MRKRALLCLALPVLGGLCFFDLSATELTRYTSRVWQVEDGLPHNSVSVVLQSRDGYLWVGTREGLARFDGVRFRTVDFPELAHTSISSLCETADGSLWIGAETGLFRLSEDGLDRFGTAHGLPAAEVRTILEDGNGDLWIAWNHDLVQWRQGEFRRPFEEELRGQGIWRIFLDGEGAVWIAGQRLLRLADGKVEIFTGEDGLLTGGLRGGYPSRNGGLWIGTTHGLSYLKDGRFSNYPKGSGPSAFVNVIYEDRNGTVWIGTYEGLSRFVDGEFFDESNEDGASYWVRCIMEDREENLWVGSDEGLTRLNPQRFVTYNKRDGLTHNWTKAVTLRKDGAIWVGVWGAGLYRFEDGKPVLQSTPLSSRFIYSMHEGRDGSLWVGLDYGHGLDWLKNGRNTHFGAKDGLHSALISAIWDDTDGNVWIGSNHGLYRFRDGVFSHYTSQNELSHNRVNVLAEQRDGTLWIGTDNGMTVWNGALSVDERFSGTAVLSIYEDAEEILWAGTRGRGLKRIGSESFHTFTTGEGLPGNTIHAILEDDRGFLWIHGGRGIFRVGREELNELASGNRSTVSPIEFERGDGIVSGGQYRYASQPVAAKGADGRLWFRTPQGLVVVDPAKVTKNELPPAIVIEQVVADRQQVDRQRVSGSGFRVSSSGTKHETRNTEPGTQNAEHKTLVLPPGRGELEIHYTALSFTDPERNRFQFKLEGYDEDWIEADTRRVAYYNNLRPGSYTFRVKGTNNDGVWNEAGAQLAIVLEPNFWQTWWFYTLCGFAAVGGVGGTVRQFLQKRHRRKLLHLEQLHAIEKERTRISRDMHDQLGANLTEIGLLTELVKRSVSGDKNAEPHLERISERTREVAQTIDEITWAVNPRNDTLQSLADYIVHYTDELFELTPIQRRLDVAQDLPHCRLAADVRHNTFLVVREALNNIVRHSSAMEMQLRLWGEGAILRIAIEDNGRGFSFETMDQSGNGLNNMKRRLESVKGRFDLSSRPGLGTRIELEIPLEAANPKSAIQNPIS